MESVYFKQPPLLSSRLSRAKIQMCHECQCTIDLLCTLTLSYYSASSTTSLVAYLLQIEFKILFKVLQGSAPKYLSNLISVLTLSHYYLRLNNNGVLLSTPKRLTKVTLGDRSFTVAVPRPWNSLPVTIRSACTMSDFKQKLKRFLFSKAFS